MEIHVDALDQGITKITLIGRLDILGVSKIDLKFSAVTGSEKKILVDMGKVEYLASIGIRTLLTGAKTVKMKQGKMVLVNLQPEVSKVLELTGLKEVIPMYVDFQQGCEALNDDSASGSHK